MSPDRLHQIFTDLRISSTTTLDPAAIRRVADFSSADRLVWGQYARFGDQIRIDATLQDIKNDRSVPLQDRRSQRERRTRRHRPLGGIHPPKTSLVRDVVKQLKASSFKPSSQSVAALRDYNQGINLSVKVKI